MQNGTSTFSLLWAGRDETPKATQAYSQRLKPTWPWTQRVVQRFCSNSKGSSLHLQQHIATDAYRQTSVPLHMRDTNQFSTRKTLAANKHDITGLHYPKLLHFSVWNMLHSCFDWALYPSRFRQYLHLLHQQHKYSSIII